MYWINIEKNRIYIENIRYFWFFRYFRFFWKNHDFSIPAQCSITHTVLLNRHTDWYYHETIRQRRQVKHLFASLGIIGETCSTVVERIDKHQRHCTSNAARRDVLAKVDHVRICLLHRKERLDLVLECKVQRLRRKVTNAVCQVTAPKRQYTCTTIMI